MNEQTHALYQRNAEVAQNYSTQVMERALQLARSQLEICERMSNEVREEYQSLMATEDPATTLRAWPKLMESSLRSTTEATTLFFKNAMAFQTELTRMTQSHMQELNQQFNDGLKLATHPGESVEPVPKARARKVA